MSLLAPTLQAFFTDRLITQRDASPRTVAGYRDSFRLLLGFAEREIGKHPFELDLADLDATLVGAFLNHLEQDRGNCASTRNARLAAIHSFYRYAALLHPEHAQTIARIMAIPTKRHERNDISYLTKPEIKVLLRAPDRTSWLGRRDYTILLTTITTGVRVSELVALRVADVTLSTGRHIHVRGKGRKQRTTPLKAETATALKAGSTNAKATTPTRCSPPGNDDRSAAKPSRCSSPDTLTQQQPAAPRSPPSTSARTPSGTPTRRCYKPNTSTSRRSPSGSATRASRPPTSTSTPTTPSNNKRSTAPPRSAPRPADTNPPTACSGSSSRSDYVHQPHQHPAPEQGKHRPANIIGHRT